MAYSPLGSAGSLPMTESLVETIAAKHGVSSATVLLSSHSLSYPPLLSSQNYKLTVVPADKRGSTVIAKSVQVSRIDQNNKIIDLDAEDMEALEIIYKSGWGQEVCVPGLWSRLWLPRQILVGRCGGCMLYG